MSGPASSSSVAAAGKRSCSWATTRACYARKEAASDCAKIERTRVATAGWVLFGTRVSRLRMKRVRQLCQAGARQGGGNGIDEALVGVGGNQRDASQAARLQAAQEGRPAS